MHLLFQNFQSCSSRLTIPINLPESYPIACQSISKQIGDEEDELSLCLLGFSSQSGGTFVFLFDLNQWYKEQLPSTCDWRYDEPKYLAIFDLADSVPLDVWINAATVTPFNSIQRPEEHFYPCSLSFGKNNETHLQLFSHCCNFYFFSSKIAKHYPAKPRKVYIGQDYKTVQ